MAITNQTNQPQQFNQLAGTTNRMAQVDSAGLLSASQDIVNGKITDGTVITLLTTDTNWTRLGAYVGTAITGTYEGQYYADGSYDFLAYADNTWRRIKKNQERSYTTTATAAGTTTLTVSSSYMQYFTGTTTQTIVMPDVTTLVLGFQFKIVNLSTGVLTVNSSGSDLITTISIGQSATITCIAIPGTTAASWDKEIAGRKVPRIQSVTSSATVTPNVDTDDVVDITAQAVGLTIANPTGTPVNKQVLMIDIKDNGGAQTIAFGNAYAAGGTALPTTTVAGLQMSMVFVYTNSLYKLRSLAQE
jgi:hypothetical protein